MQRPQTASGTVRKALEVLDQVASFERPVRFSEILESSPFPKGTLYRMLQTLRAENMLSYDEGQQSYSLGGRLVRLAHTAWSQFSLAPIARPMLDGLSKSLGETIHLAQLDNGQVLYVDKRNAERPIEMYSQAGKVGPAYCTGLGKAMMAFLPEGELEEAIDMQSYHRFTPSTLDTPEALREELGAVRQRGYAFDREEHEPGIICIAVPILAQIQAGGLIGALSVTSSTARHSLDDLAALAPKMREVADEIGALAENWRFPVEEARAARSSREVLEG